MAKKKQEVKEETKKVETKNNSNKKTNNTKKKSNNTTKTNNSNNKSSKKTTNKKKNTETKKKIETKVEKIEEVVEEVVQEENVENIEVEEEKEEKLSKTFIEKTKKLLDDHDEYVENALDEEEFEKTQEFENTQLIKIREALKPIGKPKKKRRFRKNSDIDEDFLDVNNKDEHVFLKLVLIIGTIALFIWLMPKIAFAIDEHFILDNEYEPYVPDVNEEKENKEEEKEEENIKSEVKLTEDEIRNMLNSIPSEDLMLPTSTKDYTLTFEEETMEINSIECYMIEVSAIVNDEPNHVASFAVSIYGEKIFKATTSGGYEDIKFKQ